jgi:integrase
MATVQLDYLNVFADRKGRLIAHYRRDGIRLRLRDATGKPVDPNNAAALIAAWTLVHEAWGVADSKAADAAGARAVRPHSIADLIKHYRASPEWAQLAPATRKDYEKGLKPLEDDWGHLPVAGMQRPHIGKVRDRYAWRMAPDPDKPGSQIRLSNARQANRVVTLLSILMSYAVDILGWRKDNPALRPKRLRTDGDGYRAWTQAEFLQFIERADPEWQFNALFALLTAQRGQDQVRVRWTDYDGHEIYVVQEKGRKTVKLRIEAHPALKAALDQRKAALADRSPRPLTIMARPDGTPWEKVNAFQKAAGVAIRAAGLEGCVWHGLRASALGWAADGGATEKMLMGLGGHKTGAMLQRYTRGADQQRAAAGAVRSIVVPIGGKKA